MKKVKGNIILNIIFLFWQGCFFISLCFDFYLWSLDSVDREFIDMGFVTFLLNLYEVRVYVIFSLHLVCSMHKVSKHYLWISTSGQCSRFSSSTHKTGCWCSSSNCFLFAQVVEFFEQLIHTHLGYTLFMVSNTIYYRYISCVPSWISKLLMRSIRYVVDIIILINNNLYSLKFKV